MMRSLRAMSMLSRSRFKRLSGSRCHAYTEINYRRVHIEGGIYPVLNQRVANLAKSHALAINERSNDLIKQGKQIYKFVLGQSPFPVPLPMQEALRDNAHQKDYLAVQGLKELRETIAKFASNVQGIEYKGANVMIGPGSTEFLFMLQLCYYGELLLPNPSWVSYKTQAQIVGGSVSWLETSMQNGWKVTSEVVEAHCERSGPRPRLLLLNSPNNPTGAQFREDELRALAEVARKHKILVVSDEIYGGLHFYTNEPSISNFYPEGTVVFGGISKWVGAGGWRLGYCIFPSELSWLMRAMCSVASETFCTVSAPIQHAAIAAYRPCAHIEDYLMGSRVILRSLNQRVVNALRSAGAEVHTPDGAYYVFPDFSNCPRVATLARKQEATSSMFTSAMLCEHVLDDIGVAMLPGAACGRPTDEMTARMSFVDFDGDEALRAWRMAGRPDQVDEAFLRKHCLRVAEGVDKLARWMDSSVV